MCEGEAGATVDDLAVRGEQDQPGGVGVEAPDRVDAVGDAGHAPDRIEDVVALPASALFGDSTIYVIEENRLQEKTVDLVTSRGDEVLIATDIADGATVLTSRIAEVGAGLLVEVVE